MTKKKMTVVEYSHEYYRDYRLHYIDLKFPAYYSVPAVYQRSEDHCIFCKTPIDLEAALHAHLLSVFLGNRNLFLRQECQACNNSFAKYERELSQYFLLECCLHSVKGRRGMPKFHCKKSGLYIKHDNKGIRIDYDPHVQIHVDADRKINTVTAYRKPYKPLFVYLALLKYAVSLVPSEEMPNFNRALSYLMHEGTGLHFEPFMMESKLPLPRKHPVATMAFRKEECRDMTKPYCVFLLGFSNFTLQIYVPSDRDSSRLISFYPFLVPYQSEPKKIELAARGRVSGDTVSVQMSYEGTSMVREQIWQRFESPIGRSPIEWPKGFDADNLGKKST